MMQTNYILSLLEAVKREGIVLVPNIDAKQAQKMIKSLEQYNCVVTTELYTNGAYFVLMEDSEKKVVSGYLFKLV